MASLELFEAAKERLEERLKHEESNARALEERRQEYLELREMLVELPKKVQHPMMVPFGPLASFPGHLVHTNEVLTQLSSEYFVLRSCENALGLVDRRLKRLRKEEEEVEREVRELTMQHQVATGEVPREVGATASGPVGQARSVPGVPGATVRPDKDGFLDIREPEVDLGSKSPVYQVEETDGEGFWSSLGSFETSKASKDLSQRLRALEEMEENETGEGGCVEASLEMGSLGDDMLELDHIMGQYDDLPEAPAAHETGPQDQGSTREAPRAFSPGDLCRLMGDTGSAHSADNGPASDTIVANVIRERQAGGVAVAT